VETLKTAKAVREALGAHGIYNELNSLLKGQVIITWKPQDTGRGGRGAWWQVKRKGYLTDPESTAYWHHGNKTFDVYGREHREEVLHEAIEWARDRYGFGEFVKDPWGAYQPHAQLVENLARLGITWTALEA
jgi:hypothetical protein